MLIGLIGAGHADLRPAFAAGARDSAQTMETEPFALFAGKNAIFAILDLGFSYLLAS